MSHFQNFKLKGAAFGWPPFFSTLRLIRLQQIRTLLSYWLFMATCLCHWQRWKRWFKKKKKSKAICLNNREFLTGSQFGYLRRQTLAQLTHKYPHFIQNTSRAKWPERNRAWRDRKSLSGLREAGCWLEEWLPVLIIKFDNNFLLVPLLGRHLTKNKV